MSQRTLTYMGAYSRARRAERRKFVYRFLGEKCKTCGVKSNLEIDHVDRTLKRLNVSDMLMYSEKELLRELENCQLLCKKHHNEKCRIDGSYRKPGPLIHGKISSYTHRKCRCDICTKNFREYKKNRRWLVRQVD